MEMPISASSAEQIITAQFNNVQNDSRLDCFSFKLKYVSPLFNKWKMTLRTYQNIDELKRGIETLRRYVGNVNYQVVPLPKRLKPKSQNK